MSGIIDSAGSKSGVIGTTELDYEEGAWTVVLKGGSDVSLTTSSEEGKYTKIGNLVYASGYISVSSLNSAIGGCYIAGFPFSASSGADAQGGIVNRAWNLSIADDTSLTIVLENNTTVGYMYNWDLTTGPSYLQTSEFTASGIITFCVTYTMSN